MLALHPKSSLTMLQKIAQTAHKEYLVVLAQRENLPKEIQTQLLTYNDPSIDNILSTASSLSPNTIETLITRGFSEKLAQYITLDATLFAKLKGSPTIAQNPSLNQQMQETLFQDSTYHIFLAQNSASPLTQELLALHDRVLTQKVYRTHNLTNIPLNIEGYETDLAHNPTAPQEVLEEIFAKNIDQANQALATNPATPVAILYQLSFDMRYAHLVKQNPAYTEHIKTTHAIGIFA
jgi:hypothetical protein